MASETLEKGHIYFFYRPKIAKKEVSGMDDVQRFYIILKPLNDSPEGAGSAKTRLVIIARKKLPNINDHRSRYWGFVRVAVNNVNELTPYLDEEKYETSTRGTREVGVARPVGQGVYAIVNHNARSHLAYILTLPREPGAVQEGFNIFKQGSYVLSVKNPESPNPPQAGLAKNKKARLPEHLLQNFRGRRFISITSTEYLDYNNCELLLVAATEDILRDPGDPAHELKDLEGEDEIEVAKLGEEHAVFEELKLDSEKFPVKALQGEWV